MDTSLSPLVVHLGAPTMQLPLPIIAPPHAFAFLTPQELPQAATVCSQWAKGALVQTTPSCGPKHDNLVKARAVVPKEVASVPPFFGFTDDQIKGLLSARTKALWQEVCVGADKLSELQKSVEDDILAANIPLTGLLARFAGKTRNVLMGDK